MGLFDVDDDKLKAYYRDYLAGGVSAGEMDQMLRLYATQNNCSFSEAQTFAVSGEKLGSLKNNSGNGDT